MMMQYWAMYNTTNSTYMPKQPKTHEIDWFVIWWCKLPKTISTKRLKDQRANTNALIVPCELVANMVGFWLFHHITLMKSNEKSSSLFSRFIEPNLCHIIGFAIASSPKPKKSKCQWQHTFAKNYAYCGCIKRCSDLPNAISFQDWDEVEPRCNHQS